MEQDEEEETHFVNDSWPNIDNSLRNKRPTSPYTDK